MGLWVVTIISSDAISSARRQQRRPTHRWSFSTFLRNSLSADVAGRKTVSKRAALCQGEPCHSLLPVLSS